MGSIGNQINKIKILMVLLVILYLIVSLTIVYMNEDNESTIKPF
jgi:preprotein translocase subunit SecG